MLHSPKYTPGWFDSLPAERLARRRHACARRARQAVERGRTLSLRRLLAGYTLYDRAIARRTSSEPQ